jgi:hypothetical protein
MFRNVVLFCVFSPYILTFSNLSLLFKTSREEIFNYLLRVEV